MRKWLSLGFGTLTAIIPLATVVACGNNSKPVNTRPVNTSSSTGLPKQKYITFKDLYEDDFLEATISDMSDSDSEFLWHVNWEYYGPEGSYTGYVRTPNGTWETDKKAFGRVRAMNPRSNVVDYDRNLTKYLLEIGTKTLYNRARSWNFHVDHSDSEIGFRRYQINFPIFQKFLKDSWLKNKILNDVREYCKNSPDLYVNKINYKSLISWT